ncbi:MAG: hypothetical protein U0U70_08330 [Chitinophagaceae bacterium]
MKRIDSVAQLKQEAAYDDKKPTAEFFILLKGGMRSSKHIVYFPNTGTFDVFNSIDDSWEEDITEEQLENDTHIVLAIKRGAFFMHD